MLKKYLFRLSVILSLSCVSSLAHAGSWPAIEDLSSAGTGTGSGSGSGTDWSTSFSLTGSYGSFIASASASCSPCFTPIGSTISSGGPYTASGYLEKRQPTWNPNPPDACTLCKHAAPTDAKITGEGDADVEGSVSGDANNCWPTSGSTQFLGYAKVTFSGVYAGGCDVNLNGSFSESATTVTGTLDSEGKASVTISKTITGDQYASGVIANSVSGTNQFTGNISGQLEKGFGIVKVFAKCTSSATSAAGYGKTNITTCKLTKDYDGTPGPCQ